MKFVRQTLFPTVLALALAFSVPVHAAGHKELSAQTKDKLNQLIKLHMKLDQLGARPQFRRGQGSSSAVRRAATAAMASGGKASDGIISIPHFDFTAVSAGVGYPLMFVGSQPKSGGRSTAITNVIIPVAITVPLVDANLNFTGTEVTFDGSTKVANTLRSPIYRSANFEVDPKAGRTQWGDAMQRVTFFNSLKIRHQGLARAPRHSDHRTDGEHRRLFRWLRP